MSMLQLLTLLDWSHPTGSLYGSRGPHRRWIGDGLAGGCSDHRARQAERQLTGHIRTRLLYVAITSNFSLSPATFGLRQMLLFINSENSRELALQLAFRRNSRRRGCSALLSMSICILNEIRTKMLQRAPKKYPLKFSLPFS